MESRAPRDNADRKDNAEKRDLAAIAVRKVLRDKRDNAAPKDRTDRPVREVLKVRQVPPARKDRLVLEARQVLKVRREGMTDERPTVYNFREERRHTTRRQKRIVFYTVTLCFLLAEIIGERFSGFDHLTHLVVVAYLGARTFFRDE